MAVSVADILRMPAVREADPEVLSGAGSLDRAVRWVHTTELSDIAALLREGDLVLTTGIALPDTDAGLEGFAASVADSGAAGVFIELGRRWARVPDSLVHACDAADFPLVALRREVRFASVAQSVGERIVDEQLAELRDSQRVHDTFTALSVAEAGPGEILEAVATLAGATAVLESDDRRVLDYVAGPGDATAFLEDWQRRSRAVRPRGRTEWDESSGWLVARVGRPERRWGRLVIACPAPPTPRLVAVAERGASALAMHMLHDHRRADRERHLHHELLVALAVDPAAPGLAQRCQLAGLPTSGRSLLALAVRQEEPHEDGDPARRAPAASDELVGALVHAAAVRRVPALIAQVGRAVKVLVSVPRRASATRAAEDLVAALPARLPVTAAAGSVVTDLASLDRTLREADQVLGALPASAPTRTVHRLEDLHLPGLLTLLADDDRVAAFSERELHRLRLADEAAGGRLEQTLRALLDHPTSKTAAAAALAVSRPVLYERLAQLERILGVSLDDGVARTSLHVALMAADLREGGREGAPSAP